MACPGNPVAAVERIAHARDIKLLERPPAGVSPDLEISAPAETGELTKAEFKQAVITAENSSRGREAGELRASRKL